MAVREDRRMRIPRGTAAAVLLLFTLTACNQQANAQSNAWQVIPHAFAATDEWRSGPKILLPDQGGCFLALGGASDGYGLRTGYWQATGDCTHPHQVGP